MNKSFKVFLLLASILAGVAVLLGAFAAHGLQNVLAEKSLAAFKTGVQYQFLHAIALVLIAFLALHFEHKAVKIAGYLFVAGILLFSGSLYILALTGFKTIAWLTPVGGILFVAGWVWLVYFAASVKVTDRIN